MNKPGAIVIGGHFQGLGVVRALSTRGVPVVLLDHEFSTARFSKHVKRFIKSPSVQDGEQFFRFMQEIATQYDLKGWVVFPTDDEAVYFLSKYREALSDLLRITTPEWDIIRFAYDKKATYRLAEKINLSIPMTWFPDHAGDLEKLDLPYPVIVKPAVMRDFFRVTHKKVFRAVDLEDLRIQYAKACQIIDPSNIIIQEEIPEVWNHLYSFCPFFKNGHVHARVIAKRIRQHPMDFGHASTYAKTIELPELEQLGTRFLEAINYYGLCEVEFIKDKRDGKFLFLEVNPRIWGWHTLAVRAGVNLPFLVYQDMLGFESRNGNYRKDVKWIRLITDTPTAFMQILKGRMHYREYLDSLRGEKEFAVFSWDDPVPFAMEILRLPTLWKKRGF